MNMDQKPVNTVPYKIAIGVLLAVIAVMAWMLVNQKKEIVTIKEQSGVQQNELQGELDSLLADHERVKLAYDTLTQAMQEKDSLINVKAAEIKKLIGNKTELLVVRKKLEQLRVITQNYERQIDSLYVVNRQLKEENKQIKINYNLEQQKTADLSKDKEELNARISSAAVFKAYKVVATAFKTTSGENDRLTDKAVRTDKIKVCFTIGENSLVTPGYQRFFVRISRPGDNQILTNGPTFTFQFLGQPLQFSCMETLNYDGSAADICTIYEKAAGSPQLPKGRYVVDIFTEDRQIGTGAFELK